MPNIHDFLDPLKGRLDELEVRVTRIEEKLDRILSLHSQETASQASNESLEFVPLPVRDTEYEYRALDESVSEIRIIALHGTTDDESPIECELIHASLDSKTSAEQRLSSTAIMALAQFKTLSYTWGELRSDAVIHVDGYRFAVTKNLEAALRCLRKLNSPKSGETPPWSFWWIDAICINQNEVLERNWQVDLMTRIYRKAAGMHIWLGEEADQSDVAIELARQVGNPKPRGPGEKPIEGPRTEVLSTDREQNWKALIALFQREWWNRVWVRQEVALAKSATVHCGSMTCSFQELTVTLDILVKMVDQLGYKPATPDEPSGDARSYLSRALELTNFRISRGQWPNTKYRDLTQLIPHTRDCRATDPRDKVFSLLGLVDPSVWRMHADYRLTTLQAFQNASKSIITQSQSLDILSACQNADRSDGFPSWAPNLAAEWKVRPFTPQRHWREVISGDSNHFVVENTILRAQGSLIDILDKICDATIDGLASDEEVDNLSQKWRDFAALGLDNPQRHVLDTSHINRYGDDQKWATFLSAGADKSRQPSKVAVPISSPGNFRLADSLLLPPSRARDPSADDVSRRRVREHMRKSAVGRKLCITEAGPDLGTVAMVPDNVQQGDEIWRFAGTAFPYVLRKVQGGYVVVGEAYSDRYYYPYLTKYDSMRDEVIPIM